MIPKFRAWYTPFGGSVKQFNKMKHGSAGSLLTHAEMSPDDYKIMQSTGLKDKNGVEIFEGDIVLFTIEDGFDYVYGKPGRINLSLQWGAGVRASSRGNYSLRECREVKIIGNIYENPELLEVE